MATNPPREGRPLSSVKLRGFEPKTAGAGKTAERKRQLRDRLKRELGDKLRAQSRRCGAGNLSVEVRFSLYDHGPEGSTTKDLDNMLKVLLDTLNPYMDSQRREKGLGLLSDDSCIFHIDCRKKIVMKEANEGVELKIYRYKR